MSYLQILKLVLFLTILLTACTIPSTPTHQAPIPDAKIAKIGQLKYLQHELVIGYRDKAALKNTVKRLNASILSTIPQLHLALVKINGDSFKQATRVSHWPGVVYSKPNTLMAKLPRAQKIPHFHPLKAKADQVFDQHPQFALDPRHLNAKMAWNLGLTGKDVNVAIIDDPADVTHPDLTDNWIGKAYDPLKDKVYTSAQQWKKYASHINNNHGTFVASSVSAAQNGQGIVGIAPDSKFMPVTIFMKGDSYSSFVIAKAIVWSTDNGAQVINNSWTSDLGFDVIRQALNYALSKKVTVVAAGGNYYRDEHIFPASNSGIIASAALDASNRKTTFSSMGRYISTAAPGQDVLLANPTWMPQNSGDYELISGTSFSSPYTAGVAAMILQKCPAATPYQVRRVMEITADSSIGSNPQGFDRETGWGRLDAGAIAQYLTNCSKLPQKGATLKVNVQYLNGEQKNPGLLADVLLKSKGFTEDNLTDSSAQHLATTNNEGQAIFAEIAPGEYDIYVGGADLKIIDGQEKDRGTFIGTVTTTSGSTLQQPDQIDIHINAKLPNLNPTDPYEPNDKPEDATPIRYGETTKISYIFGQPQDADYFKFEAKKDQKIKALTFAAGQFGGQLDTYLFLKDYKGKVLAKNDDRGDPRIDQDSEIIMTIPKDGQYYLHVSSCAISCIPEHPENDNSPFNKYKLKLELLQ